MTEEELKAWEKGRDAAMLAVAEQKCERGTSWFMALDAALCAIRDIKPPTVTNPKQISVGSCISE